MVDSLDHEYFGSRGDADIGSISVDDDLRIWVRFSWGFILTKYLECSFRTKWPDGKGLLRVGYRLANVRERISSDFSRTKMMVESDACNDVRKE